MQWKELESEKIRNWAALVPLSTFAYYIVPIVGFVAPLFIYWMSRAPQHTRLRLEAAKAFNFQLGVLATAIGAFTLYMIGFGVELWLDDPQANFMITAFVYAPATMITIWLAVVIVVFPFLNMWRIKKDRVTHYPVSIELINSLMIGFEVPEKARTSVSPEKSSQAESF